jgi:type IV secretion system protein VirD4
MVRRVILLIVYLVAGYVLGNLVVHLILIPVAAIKHLSTDLVTSLAVAGGLLGVLIGFGKWRAGSAPTNSWGVHGSAHWASEREVRASLGGADGLIVGRALRKIFTSFRMLGVARK